MTTHYRTQAFIFKKNDVNESDRVFSVFTNDFGRLDIFAKAIRKDVSKLRSGMDIFFMSEVEFIQGRSRKTLTDANLIEKYSNIYNIPERFEVANRIGDVLGNLIKGEEKDRNMFNLLSETLSRLNSVILSDKKYILSYYYFLWNVLALLGYHPEVQKCNVCQNALEPYNVYFSDKLGGIICEKCLNHDIKAHKINSDIVKVLRLILRKEWQVLSRLKIESFSQKLFKETSDNYYSYILSSHVA